MTSPAVPRMDHYALIDFDRNGSFLETGDDVTSDVLTPPGVSIVVGRDTPRAFSPPAANLCGWTLNNESGDYANLFTGSAHYGYITRGAPAQFRIDYGADVPFNDPGTSFNSYDVLFRGTNLRTLFSGTLDKPDQQDGTGEYTVKCQILGNLATITDATVTTQAVYVNKYTGEIINLILDEVGWPANKRIIATGTIQVLYWWANGQSALSLLVQMMITEGPGAVLYEDELGNIVFRDTNYRESNNARSKVSQATFADSTAADDAFNSTAVSFNDPYTLFNGDSVRTFFYSGRPTLTQDEDAVINDASAIVNTRLLQATAGVVWQYGQTITLGASGTFEVFADMPEDPVQQVVTPLAGTDFTASPALAGVSVSTLSGSTVKITLTAGVGGSTVTGLQLRAKLFQKVGDTRIVPTISTATLNLSKARFGYKPWSAPLWREIHPNSMQDLINAYVLRYLQVRPQVSFDVYASDTKTLYALLELGVSDRVTFVVRRYGISLDCLIDRVEYQVISRPVFLVRITAEAVYETTVAKWDQDRWDNLAAKWGHG